MSHSATVGPWRTRERTLARRGEDIRLVTARKWHAGGVPVSLDTDAEQWVLPARTFGRHPALFLYSPLALWRALGGDWDVIDLHEEPFAVVTAEVLLLRWLRRQPAPYVLYSAQNIAKRYPVPFRWFERAALRGAAGLSVCNSAAGEICVAKGFPGAPTLIPLGVDASTDAEAGAPEDASVDADRGHPHAGGPVVVGFVGRLVEEKGVQVLLEAVSEQPRLRARLAGSGPLATEITSRAEVLGVADRVELVGAVAPERMGEFYASLDVLAVPSVPTARWTEQFGRVAVEAMATGVPVVSSDAGALPDVVGGAGLVVPHGDPTALAGALLRAAGSERDALRATGFTRAAECSWDAVTDQYQRLYRAAARTSTDAGHRELRIVVVAYGGPEMLRRALEPVSGLPVTVVDNSSMPEIRELCADLGVRYIDPGANLGFGAAVNLALREPGHADADVLLLNPDAVIGADDVQLLHQRLRAGPTLASVGPAQVDESGKSARVRWPFPSPFGSWVDALGLGRMRSDRHGFVIGSVLLLRAEALAQVGGLDERFFLYAEETDWAYRAHLLGWRHGVVEEVQAMHVGAGTSSDPRRRDAMFFASQERYLRKHFGAGGWASARLAAWWGASVRALVLRGERGAAARRRAALYRLGPVRVEARFRKEA
ncbi:glycosyltransferase [Microbacterium esteraromaticum]|uniref:D-inositol 3-phosphate glycosyltransferase n=1 Tax=Microbacterium esteraromaticum TaxID=57043 RepID=A0A939IUS5_9MICO|nr:glycosyltransferase [Microbacterium esteraromaticum]MBN8415483.1 glycosyltransferase [Microbacterium esteraromaticum]